MESGSNVCAPVPGDGQDHAHEHGRRLGVIFGTMFMGGAKGKPERSSLDGAALIELWRGA